MGFSIDVRPNAFSTKTLQMDENYVKFEDKQLRTDEITEFSNGLTKHSVNGIHTKNEYYMNFRDARNNIIKVRFIGSKMVDPHAESKYSQIVDNIWNYFGNRILKDVHKRILEGGKYKIEQCTLSREGITFERKPLFGKRKEYTIDWWDLTMTPYQGFLTLKSKKDKKARTTLTIGTGWNVNVLYSLISWLFEDGNRINALKQPQSSSGWS